MIIDNIKIFSIMKVYCNVCNTYRKCRKTFRLKNIDETRNYLIEETKKNELMSKKHKKVYKVSNCIEHLPILISTVSGCVFCFFFFRWYFYRNYEFCNRIKSLCNNCRS